MTTRVVAVLGHVDHGKTTLMDALRRRSQKQHKQAPSKSKSSKKTKDKTAGVSKDVAGTEAGGITPIISAFQVAPEEGQDNDTRTVPYTNPTLPKIHTL